MRIKHINQGSPEWYTMRSIRIGASDIPIIMKTSPFTTYNDLVLIKSGKKEVTETPFMKIGKDKEDDVRIMASRDIGIEFEPAIYLYDPYALFMASLDGISPDGKQLLEIKVVGQKSFNKFVGEGIPEYYYQQMLWQMMCSGAEVGHFYAYCRDSNQVWMKSISTNTSMIEAMIGAAKIFLKDVETYQHMGLLPEAHAALPVGFRELEDELYDLDLSIGHLKEAREIIIERITRLCDGKAIRGVLYSSLSYERKGSFDEELLKAVVEDLDKYRKPKTHVWTIRKNG